MVVAACPVLLLSTACSEATNSSCPALSQLQPGIEAIPEQGQRSYYPGALKIGALLRANLRHSKHCPRRTAVNQLVHPFSHLRPELLLCSIKQASWLRCKR